MERHHPRAEIEEAAHGRLQRQPTHITDSILPPYCPRRYGNIVKCRAKDYGDLQRIAFELSKVWKKENRATPPCWCAVERSPESGAARREIRQAADVATKVLGSLGYLEVDENAIVWYRREEVTKFGGIPKMWRKARFSTIRRTEHNLDWNIIKDALAGNL